MFINSPLWQTLATTGANFYRKTIAKLTSHREQIKTLCDITFLFEIQTYLLLRHRRNLREHRMKDCFHIETQQYETCIY